MNTRRLWGEIELASGLLQLGPQAQTADGGPRRRSNPTGRTDFPPYCLNFSQGLQLHRPLTATLPSTTPPRASPVVQGNFDDPPRHRMAVLPQPQTEETQLTIRIGLYSEDRSLQPLLASALGKEFQILSSPDEAGITRILEIGRAHV